MKVAAETDWTDSRIREFWNDYAARTRSDVTYFSKQVGAGIAAFLRKKGALRGRVLDYGCGPGFLCAELLALGARVAGCDWSEKSVELANQRFAGNALWEGAIALGHGLGGLNPPYDLVTCIETIEHVPSRAEDRFFGDLCDLVGPSGLLFITTPNAERLSDALVYCPFCDTSFHRMQHVRSFDATSLRELLEKHHFDVTFVGALNFAALQPPKMPSALDVSPRELARGARWLASSLRDKLRGPVEPDTGLEADPIRFPHLCALARLQPRA